MDFISEQFSNIYLNFYIILTVAILYLFLHANRHNKVLQQVSILLGFFPVLIHEVGHALSASISGGKVHNIYMVLTPRGQEKTESQGYAVTTPKNRLSGVLIGLMGYMFPPFIYLLGIILLYNQMSIAFLSILLLLTLYYFWHTSQKWIPLLLLLGLIYSVYYVYTNSIEVTISMYLIHFIYNLILGLLLGEIIQSIIITTKVNFSRQKMEWDGLMLRRLTFIPATVWWFVWTVASGFTIYMTFKILIDVFPLSS